MPDLSLLNLDMVAVAWFLVATVGYGYLAGSPWLLPHSITGAIQLQRLEWMRNMAVRDVRIVDAQLLANLSQGNAFFASTSAIIIGGLSALLGSGDKLQVLLERLPYAAKPSALLLEVKMVFIIAIFVFAFFKFAWAFRLSHYTAIMIGSTPIFDNKNQRMCEDHALRTAYLIGIAAEHTNAGIRSFFYAIAAMAWFFHPLAFILTTTWIIGILIRRDFFSRARRVIAGDTAVR